MRKVCFINRCYWPDSEATGQLLTELCEYLAPTWDVSAVVGQPNWEVAQLDFVRHGVERRNGVEIHRLKHLQLPKNVGYARIRNLISFTLAVRKWGKRHGAQYLQTKSSAVDRPTLVCETDPFLLPLVVGPLAKRLNTKLVYYLQDIYPDVAVAVGVTRNSLPIRFLRSRLKAAYLKADRIVVLDGDMLERLVCWGIDPNRISVVPNWMDCSIVVPTKENNAFRINQNIDNRFVVMHSGNMGMTQRLDVLVQSMLHPEVAKKAVLALVGNGAKRESLEQLANQAENIRFYDYQPKEQLNVSLSAADLHVVSMDQAITGCLAPSKLYGILASATPVLSIVPKGNAVWKLVDEHRLGWNVEPGDTNGIRNAITAAAALHASELRAIGERARQLALNLYDKHICCGSFEAVLRSLT